MVPICNKTACRHHCNYHRGLAVMIPLSRDKKKVWQPELRMIHQFLQVVLISGVNMPLITRQPGYNRVSWEIGRRLEVIKNNGKTSICLFSVTVTSFNDPPSHHFGLIQPSGEIGNQWFKVKMKCLIYLEESQDIFTLTPYNTIRIILLHKIARL